MAKVNILPSRKHLRKET